MAWVAGYTPRLFARPKMVTHPSTNRARCRVTSLIRPTLLLLRGTCDMHVCDVCLQAVGLLFTAGSQSMPRFSWLALGGVWALSLLTHVTVCTRSSSSSHVVCGRQPITLLLAAVIFACVCSASVAVVVALTTSFLSQYHRLHAASTSKVCPLSLHSLLILVFFCVLTSESWCQGSKVPSIRTQLVDQERMRSCG